AGCPLRNHPQLLGPSWRLAGVGLAAMALPWPGPRRARAAWVLAGMAAAAEAWSSYYLWWFLAFGAAIAFVVGLALRSTRPRVLEALRRGWPAIAPAPGGSPLLLPPPPRASSL